MTIDYEKDQLAYALANALKERDEAREKAERYRLEANAMMLQRDEAREDLQEIKEYGTEEINAAVELRQKLAQALTERDEAREAFVIATDQMVIAQGKVREANKERDEAREKYATEATEYMLTVNKLCGERDEARAALMRIAKAALEETK